jgi:hypothetical protein
MAATSTTTENRQVEPSDRVVLRAHGRRELEQDELDVKVRGLGSIKSLEDR